MATVKRPEPNAANLLEETLAVEKPMADETRVFCDFQPKWIGFVKKL